MASSACQALLLIDGYNIIGAWPSLRDARDFDGLETARARLVEILANYSAFKGFDSRLVFDAYNQHTPGAQENITQNLAIYYTHFGQTADSYIEKACAQFRSDLRKFEQRLIVATSDRAQQLTVVGYGAEWMSAQQLAADVEGSTQRIKRRQTPSKRSPNRFLAHSLDPLAQERLAKLRLGLKQ
ncbi:MAG: NYN domain-containing protein [Leptolyngbyaceae cyanobacterium MO_188.B28]|nr:NYN domain-containing protein [Leptolyngbyaceae cyanobacterium MO_188.B28]